MLDLLLSPPVIGLVLMLALTTLYKIALPLKPPWYRGLPGALLAAVVFLVGATGLRLYLDWLTGTGYTYGALAAPIAFLLGTFFIGLAIVLGAHFNASIQALWPVPLSDRRNRLARAAEQVSAAPGDAWRLRVRIAARPARCARRTCPDVLLTPDVAVLERAVRERPDVAAAVLEQMRYGRAPRRRAARRGGDRAAAAAPGARRPTPRDGRRGPVAGTRRTAGVIDRPADRRAVVIAADGLVPARGAIVGARARVRSRRPPRGEGGVEALTALVARLLGRLHGLNADAVCPGGWPWAVSLLGVAVGLRARGRGRGGGAVAAPDRVALRARPSRWCSSARALLACGLAAAAGVPGDGPGVRRGGGERAACRA